MDRVTGTANFPELAEVEIDGCYFELQPIYPGIWNYLLQKPNVTAWVIAESLGRSEGWAHAFFWGNTELSIELFNVICGISGMDDV